MHKIICKINYITSLNSYFELIYKLFLSQKNNFYTFLSFKITYSNTFKLYISNTRFNPKSYKVIYKQWLIEYMQDFKINHQE